MPRKDKICVMTATRAEYSLLRPVITELAIRKYDVRVAVTGMHLSADFGHTLDEINEDHVNIDTMIEILPELKDSLGISKAIASAIEKFAKYFNESRPKLLIVLGDRYETLAVCTAAMTERIPIAHLHGGETTEGAIDECIRHAVTKMSYLHFTSCEQYRRRVIQLGESPERVFNVGGVGVENVKNLDYMTKEELFSSLGLSFHLNQPYAVVTFHPVTLENETYVLQIKELFAALSETAGLNYIITKSNADEGGTTINRMIDDYVKDHPRAEAFYSLGMRRYLSAAKYSEMVIGNSSSGILEIPSLGIPTINIGDRQKGRVQATSVINCNPLKEEIKIAIQKGLSNDSKETAACTKNPYENGRTSQKIADIIDRTLSMEIINLKKTFNDII